MNRDEVLRSLTELYHRRLISYDEAMGHATEPDELRTLLGPPPRTMRR